MSIIKELEDRNILDNITNREKADRIKPGDGVYIGFDPTAISLHLGNYLQIVTLIRFQKLGLSSFAVLGGATGMIGDPSGKNSERVLLNSDDINKNKLAIKKQLEGFGLTVIDNYDFYSSMNVLTYLRDVGKLLNINYMINKDIVKSRLENGISYTEFSYQLIQGWDFKVLYDKYNVKVQVGGSDQWGNITSGLEIIRKTVGDDNQALGITTKLLTTSTGKKFGKSEGNALYLDDLLTSPYQIYQYLLNSSDEDIEKLLLWLTLEPVDKIKEIISRHNLQPFKRVAQKCLAKIVVRDLHDERVAQRCEDLSVLLFSNDISSITDEDYQLLDGTIPTFSALSGNIQDILVTIGVASSKREAREFIINSAIRLGDNTILDINWELPENNKYQLLRKGKKSFYLIKPKASDI